MSALAREDVFVVDDLIIQNTIASLFDLDKTDRKKLKATINELAEKWKPYRTYVCVHLRAGMTSNGGFSFIVVFIEQTCY
jgi:DNA-3-methyladenine glycosylase II